MARNFHPIANHLWKLLLIAGVLGLFLVLLVVNILKTSPYISQNKVPIPQVVPFSHAHHVGGLGLDCRYCHTTVEYSADAGMPPTHTCMTCHSRIWTQARILEPVRESYRTDKPLHWQRVYRLPDYVYFDHSIHVNKGVGCTTCHGPIDQMALTWKARNFFMNDCLLCHTHPEKYLRPKDQVFNVDYRPPPNQMELGRKLLKEYHIRTKVQGRNPLTDCYVCHR